MTEKQSLLISKNSNSLNSTKKPIPMIEKQRIVNSTTLSEITAEIVYDIPKQAKILKDTIFEIRKEPAMQLALDLISPLGENKEITLRGKGNSIANAITVANIITTSLLKGKSKIHKTTVDSDPIREMGGLQSTIEIVLKITNPKNE